MKDFRKQKLRHSFMLNEWLNDYYWRCQWVKVIERILPQILICIWITGGAWEKSDSDALPLRWDPIVCFFTKFPIKTNVTFICKTLWNYIVNFHYWIYVFRPWKHGFKSYEKLKNTDETCFSLYFLYTHVWQSP